MRTADFDFALPEAQIAQAPMRPRDAARLLVVRPDGLEDRIVRDLPDLLRPGDVLVVNDTRVIPARLRGRRGEAAIEIMLNRAEEGGIWEALVRNARRLRPGDSIRIEGAADLPCTVLAVEGGTARLNFGPDPARLAAALDQAGEVPLPPYIARPEGPSEQDRADYQTVFARRPGAVAAPTASLHFTDAMLAALEARGVSRATVTLHVGAGTFLPLRAEDPRRHRLHAEWGEVTEAAAARINAARAGGGRIVAVGTTALRLLETAAQGDKDGMEDPRRPVRPFRGLTDLYLLPGHRFRAADLLMTNFHLPKSTLFMLVSAFAGTARMRAAYDHAIAQGYRFYSYGDGSLLHLAEDAP
ncbi:tRNA preQ1(34) S-adenosylmethionine ribosyltransferase-isomerase QueA [Paracraurococcus ruber]|uniref:S-adenosylmethionine:tRNA ribosyltransferase-isomerase n=1 Tax=Paracraurococcus ruber TaxID=77675 RepID=A0ABS1CUP7_9PROT|nr:tRNA preQ1(34) S-adenosylmethionine ribosyltransferase-isomerase QueA [Paracraurococcus ruber]MBK1658223.1 tRNA preQ1(34) S-adenosylmethionine ribosyltransferase-isomerase QueA [Paracraurococcus ruber]TDG30618.1 tRNA preQ1(34) S-adenosylmethionine ribosyltransferase-isomerase QueA [Paracraurococcus ruber]